MSIKTTHKKIIFTPLIACALWSFPLANITAQSASSEPSPENKVVTMTAGDYSEDVSLHEVFSWLKIQPQLVFDYNHISEGENTRYCKLLEPCALTHTIRTVNHIRNIDSLSVDRDTVAAFVQDFARRANHEPINASFRMKDSDIAVATKHIDGVDVNVDESINLIIDGLHSYSATEKINIPLAYDSTPAKITAKNISDLGIRELIGEGRSNFVGSSKDRIHNISTAASRFDGLIIGPGEEFSFVEHLGPVDGEHGYKEELVIKDNQTKPEFGGGICQVSTTVFRGAILTGMEITARRNHSYPVKYYEPVGFDATIYLPAPDMRFKNNTPGHILLQADMEGTELVFRYYGTKDGRTVTMDGPHITQKNSDGSMKTYFTQKVVDKNGNEIIDDTFGSNYKSPKDYPKPGDVSDVQLTEKPRDWSKREWKEYLAKNA